MSELKLCTNCKYSKYVELSGKTMIQCTKEFKKVTNVRNTFSTPLFSKFKRLSSVACIHYKE